MHEEEEIRWVGSAYHDLLELPEEARRSAGFQLGKVLAGLDPDDWKPFNEVGPGTKEIRLFESGGTYRLLCVAKFPEAVYVLHCFQKNTRATSRHDKAIAESRYRAIASAREGQQ